MKPTRRPISLQGLRLLLIEDNPLTQRISTEMLILNGVQATVVGSATEALKISQGDIRYDIALADFDLPDIDGITLAQQLAHDHPTLNLTGFSVCVIDETLSQRTSTLFLGTIQKPVPWDELSRPITHYLHDSTAPPLASENDNKRLDLQQLSGDIQVTRWQEVREWLALFEQHTPPILSGIDTVHVAHGDERIKRLTHQLKSGCASIGMRSASTICAILERQPSGDLSFKEEIQQSPYEVEHWLEKEKPSRVQRYVEVEHRD